MHVVPSTGQKPAVLRAAHVVARKAALAKQKFSTLTNRRLSKQALRWDVTGGRARPKGVGCPSPSGGLSSGLCPSTPSEPGNECGFSFIPKVLKLVLTGLCKRCWYVQLEMPAACVKAKGILRTEHNMATWKEPFNCKNPASGNSTVCLAMASQSECLIKKWSIRDALCPDWNVGASVAFHVFRATRSCLVRSWCNNCISACWGPLQWRLRQVNLDVPTR